MNILLIVGDWIKAGVLTAGVTLTGIFQPVVEMDREARIIEPIPIEEKAELFEEDILDNHLSSEYVFLYELPRNLGDQCVWNGVHVAYRAIRYGYTQDEVDLKKLKRFVKTLKLLQTHPETGETVLLRGRIPLDEYDGTHGGYSQVHQNDTLIWQEDASGDPFVSHVYALALSYRYGDKEVKKYVVDLAIDLYNYIEENDFHLTNSDGSRTRFSKVGPGITASPARVNGLLLLQKLLEVASKDFFIVELSEVKDDYRDYAIGKNQIHVAANSFVMFFNDIKYPNVNLVKMSIHGLLELETKEDYEEKYIKALRRGWRVLEVNGDVIITSLLYEYHPESIDGNHVKAARIVMNEFSTKHKVGTEVDLTDDDTIRHVKWGDFDEPYVAAQPYPVWQQPAKDYYWQRDPHDLQGHIGCYSGCKKFTGLDFLVAYYMSKTYGLL